MPSKKNKKIIFASFAIISLIILAFAGNRYYEQNKEEALFKIYYNHENLSKAYCEEVEKKFDSCVVTNDTSGLRFLSLQLETRLKMEDFRIRSKEAEKTKLSAYTTTIVTAFATLIAAIIALWKRGKGESKITKTPL